MATFKHQVGQTGTVTNSGTIYDILHSFYVGDEVQILKIEDNGVSKQHYLCELLGTEETQWLTEDQFQPNGEAK